MLHVNNVKADDGRVQTNVGFCDGVAKVIAARVREMVFHAVERDKYLLYGLLIGLLGSVGIQSG